MKIRYLILIALLLLPGALNAGEDTTIYLPLVQQPLYGSLQNGSFEEGWTNLPPAPGWLINQQPMEWTLSWVELGEPIFGSGILSGGVPECVHKHNFQLPPDEQLGGEHALVLDGEWTYKIFHAGAAFGATLTQTISSLPVGAEYLVTVPILVDLHGDPDPWTAESGVWVDDQGDWVNAGVMGSRSWYEHVISFTVPQDGEITLMVRVKSKWNSPKDFFIDDVRMNDE